jgi:ParB family chromosome partitioning protein
MTARKSKQWRKISKLIDHPAQANYADDLPKAELAALVHEMVYHGDRRPVEILPDGTIIAGHQRVRAARQVGWSQIKVVVRADLAQLPQDAVEAHLIRDNLSRPHLSPLCRARAIRRLLVIESGCEPGGLGWNDPQGTRERIANQLGLRLRSISRYLRVLEAPAEVQRAFDRGEISLAKAGKVAGLPESDQQTIDDLILDGRKASKVVSEYLRAARPRKKTVKAAFRRLARALERELPTIRKSVYSGRAKRFVPFADVLRESSAVLGEIVERLDDITLEPLPELPEDLRPTRTPDGDRMPP